MGLKIHQFDVELVGFLQWQSGSFYEIEANIDLMSRSKKDIQMHSTYILK